MFGNVLVDTEYLGHHLLFTESIVLVVGRLPSFLSSVALLLFIIMQSFFYSSNMQFVSVFLCLGSLVAFTGMEEKTGALCVDFFS